MSRFGLKDRIIMCDVKMSLIFSNVDWFSGSQFQVVPFFSRGRIVLVM